MPGDSFEGLPSEWYFYEWLTPRLWSIQGLKDKLMVQFPTTKVAYKFACSDS